MVPRFWRYIGDTNCRDLHIVHLINCSTILTHTQPFSLIVAAIVDREMSIFKQKQENLTKLRQKQQTLMEQHSENEMVKSELGLLTPNNEVYKKAGPILMKHEVSEAIDTVDKRLEFIKSDQNKVEAQAKALEEEMQKIAQGVKEKQVRGRATRFESSDFVFYCLGSRCHSKQPFLNNFHSFPLITCRSTCRDRHSRLRKPPLPPRRERLRFNQWSRRERGIAETTNEPRGRAKGEFIKQQKHYKHSGYIDTAVRPDISCFLFRNPQHRPLPHLPLDEVPLLISRQSPKRPPLPRLPPSPLGYEFEVYGEVAEGVPPRVPQVPPAPPLLASHEGENEAGKVASLRGQELEDLIPWSGANGLVVVGVSWREGGLGKQRGMRLLGPRRVPSTHRRGKGGRSRARAWSWLS